MSTILDKIVASKRAEIEQARLAATEEELEARLCDAPPGRNFLAALNRPHSVQVIAEVKKASPSAGVLRTEFDPVGTAENGRELLRLAEELKPDVVLLDISMPLLNGLDACKQLIQTSPQAKVIFVTMHADADYVAEAFRCRRLGIPAKALGRVRAGERNSRGAERPLLCNAAGNQGGVGSAPGRHRGGYAKAL